MKTAGAVFKKLKEVKYRHLTDLYRKYLRRAPDLCKYNKPYRIQTDNMVREIRLCMLHQPAGDIQPHLLDICQEVGHCDNCNAFVCIHTKESVKDMFEMELQSQSAKARKYPDICALEWVLDQTTSVGPLSWIERAWLYIKRNAGFYPFL